jgi:branched-chain amino acid transport system permease protein
MIDIFLQQLINGLVMGSVYAIVALGYTLVYGIMRLINFAHGEVVMIGAMIALSVINTLENSGLPAFVIVGGGLLTAIPSCMVVGYLIERIAYRPLRGAPSLAPLITAIGVSIVLQNLAMMIWGKEFVPFPPLLDDFMRYFSILDATINSVQLFIIAVSVVMMVGLNYLINKTQLGNAMRATAQNAEVAGLMGVNTNQIISLTFIIGSALAAVAGMMVTMNYNVAHYDMGFMLGLKAFTAAVLGGIGHLRGAMLGGILLGVIESMGAGYLGELTHGLFGSNYQDVFAFFTLIGVLIFKPSGLLGKAVGERP